MEKIKWRGRTKAPLVGEEYGEWTVVNTDNAQTVEDKILCRCVCGTEREVCIHNLKMGTSTSCGKRHSHHARGAWTSKYEEPYIGKQYNEWTLLEGHNNKKTIGDNFLARCSCGVEREVLLINLITGRSKSCGHAQYDYMFNEEFIYSRKNVYEQRIGEVFHGFKLLTFERYKETGDLYFEVACKNGHEHVYFSKNMPSDTLKNAKCWCEEKNPVVRLRLKIGLTLEEVGQFLHVSKEAVRLYEKNLIEGQPLRKKNNQSDVEKYLNNHSFKKLVSVYELTKEEQLFWIDEILNNKEYEER